MFSISSLVSLTKVTQIATDCKGQLNYEQFWSWKSKNKTKQNKKNGQMFWLDTFLRHFSAVQLMSLTIHCCIWTRLIVVQCSLTCDSVSSCKKWEATSCTGSSTLCAQWLGKWVFWSYHHFHAYFSAPCCKNWTLTGYYVMCTCAMREGVAYGEQHPLSRCQ